MEFITTLSKAIQDKLKNPVIAALVAIIFGFAFGLTWGWVIQPTEWVDAAPELLNSDYQKEYLSMTIDSFTVNSDTTQAMKRWQDLGSPAIAQQRLEELKNNPGTQDRATIEAFSVLVNAAAPPVEASAEEPAKKPTSPLVKYALIALVLLVVAIVGYFAFRLLKPAVSGERTPAQEAAEVAKSTERTDYSKMGLETPITQGMTSYIAGDDLYDESFSIESQAG